MFSLKGHLVFDFDGTIVSSMSSVLRDSQEILCELLQRPVTLEEVRMKASADPMVFFSRFGLDLKDTELSRKLGESWEKKITSRIGAYAPYEGMLEFLEKLEKEGYLLYVWTAGHRKGVTKILNEYGLKKYFKDYRCFDDISPKPDPIGLIDMLKSVDPKRVIMIGDSPNDIIGAQRFGCMSILARWDTISKKVSCKGHEGPFLESYGANFVAFSLDECYQIVTSYFAKKLENSENDPYKKTDLC